jgi:hypothetical protein
MLDDGRGDGVTMDKFDFLIGDWALEYRIPKSSLHDEAAGTGAGTFRRALGGKFVIFDYVSLVDGEQSRAHAVFGRDAKSGLYRYWWFEDSGAFLTATCDFVDADTLAMSWHDTLLRQTFRKTGPGEVVLRMEQPARGGGDELVLEVVLRRQQPHPVFVASKRPE